MLEGTRSECFLEKIVYVPPRTLDVYFNSAVEKTSAEQANNYLLQPIGLPERATLDAVNPQIVHLEMPANSVIKAIGKEYILHVSNVQCTNGLIIGDGAGSTAGVILNRQDLSEMFVFPNPLRPSDGQDFVTFANLTPLATIRIYTMSGSFIREVVEADGNGGTEWHLDDVNGKIVPAGIYLYYATGKDSMGRDVETKLGKFAIVR